MAEIVANATLGDLNKRIAELIELNRKSMEFRIQRIENTYLAVQLLASEGLLLPVTRWQTAEYPTFSVEAKDLIIIRRVLGKIPLTNKEPVQDTKKQLVWWCYQTADEKFGHIIFRIKRKLPRGAKCRIVTKKATFRAVVCEA